MFACKQPSAYDAADVGFLQLVANQVAVAVENALAFRLAPLRADALGWNVAGAADAKESTAIRETREAERKFLQNSAVRLL